MLPKLNSKNCLIFLTFCTVPYFISASIRRYLENKLKKLKRLEEQEESNVFCITPRNEDCWKHVMNKKTCGETCSYECLRRIVKRISNAKQEVLMCMNHLTVNDITNAMIAAKQRGVDVRCITDSEMMKSTGSKIVDFKKNGLPVKIQFNGNFIMHHKFFIIDGESEENRMVVSGSLNYTMQGFTRNFEQVMETNNYNTVSRFRAEFEYLWMTLKEY